MELKRALLACTIAAFSLPAIPFAAAQESLPYSFSAPGCSAQPDSAPVFDAKGDIYGTCKNSSGDGFVYELSPKSGGIWTEQVIYTFGSGGSTAAGSGPNGVIFDAKQVNLYGTTSAGGAEGSGVVYELSPNGSGG